jgi:tetratricopeptide (TPR) repeat protein
LKTISHYCQKCRAANQAGERNCRACGTRLMLVVFPASVRHDEGIIPSFYEDHLLERVSLLELQLAQAIEKIGMLSAFFAREVKELKKDQKFIRNFSEALKKFNPQIADEINKKHDEDFIQTVEKFEFADQQKQFLKSVLLHHNKPNAQLFTHLLKEGVRLLEQKEERQAFQMLERAALLSAQNVPLLVFVAENFYRADKFEESKSYLEKAFKLAPENEKILLLLGAIYADAGETNEARKFLSVPANNEKTLVFVHFVWGMMAAFEENWTEALAAFKQSLGNADLPELNYLIGCVYFQLERYDAALQFFQNSAVLDSNFSDAWFMQGVIYKIWNENENEKITLKTISEKREAGAQCIEYLNGKKPTDLQTALPFLHFKKIKKNLMSGGSPRLNRFFREQIYKVIE